MTARQKAIEAISNRKVASTQNYMDNAGEDIYGSYVFGDDAQKEYLPRQVYKKLRQTIDEGKPFDASIADAVAQAKLYLIDEVDDPRVFKFDIAQFPIMVYGIHAAESYPRLEKVLDDALVKPLKRIPGVASAAAIALSRLIRRWVAPEP